MRFEAVEGLSSLDASFFPPVLVVGLTAAVLDAGMDIKSLLAAAGS